MARYKEYNYEQTKLLPIRYCEQILPSAFEYALNDVIDQADLTVFDGRYKNDATGAPAYDPRILLKIIRFAYGRGVMSSRRIAQLCRENVVMMALSADTQPDFTTIADFVASSPDEIVVLFREVLLICDSVGLLGRELVAIDGCKLPANASKEWSGTKADLAKKHQKLTKAIRVMLAQHREQDARECNGMCEPQERQYLATLRARARKIRQRPAGSSTSAASPPPSPRLPLSGTRRGSIRFTLRGKTKVNAQWLLYCLVHNIGKIQRYGPASA